MIFASDAVITFVPRFWRMYLALWDSRRWRLPATPALIFPDAVSLKRFLAPDFVFSFGISLRSDEAPSSGVLMNRPGMPWARRLRRVGLIDERGGDCKARARGAAEWPETRSGFGE